MQTSKRKVRTPRRAAPQPQPEVEIKLAHGYDPDAAQRGPGSGRTGLCRCGLGPDYQVCPGCEQRIALRPLPRLHVARQLVGATPSEFADVFVHLLGLCDECSERLSRGESVRSIGLTAIYNGSGSTNPIERAGGGAQLASEGRS